MKIPLPAPVKKLAILYGAKETVGVATGAAAVAEFAPGEAGAAAGGGFFARFWTALKDAPRIPGELLSALSKIRLSPGEGIASTDLSLHATLSQPEISGGIFAAGITAGSLVAMGAVELAHRAIRNHRLGNDIPIDRIPRAARKEIMRELKQLGKNLPKDDPEQLRPTLKLIEDMLSGEGSVGIMHTDTGGAQLTLNKKPVSGLSPLPQETCSRIEAILTRHAHRVHSLTADAVTLATRGGTPGTGYSRLVAAANAKLSSSKHLRDTAVSAVDHGMMFGGQIGAVGGNAPQVADEIKQQAAAQEQAATPREQTARLLS